MNLFHKRCDREIERLEHLLDYEQRLCQSLRGEIATLQAKPYIPVGSEPANVYYMDDHRLLEMEADGDVPT
jgi:hypothetical protein